MLATLTVTALVCAGSVVCGEAIARVLSIDRWRPWSPAVGLALLIVVTLVAVKLPGGGTAGAVAFALLVAAATVVVLFRDAPPRPRAHLVALTALTALAACIPYLSNGRFGIPGVSFNNDLANHVPWTRALQTPGMQDMSIPSPGYPLGTHSLAASLSSLTGIDLAATFPAVLIACVVLIGWTALGLIGDLPGPRRVLGALLVAIAYTVSAFYTQANFKELLLTLFLLAMVAAARDAARHPMDRQFRRGIQLGTLAAGTVATFSYAGLVWPAAAAAAWAALAGGMAVVLTRGGIRARIAAATAPLRRALPLLLGAVVACAVLLLGDLARLLDALEIFGSSPADTGILPSTEVGNLVGPVSKREIFGIWPNEDFRRGIAATAVNQALGALAILVACYAAAWWVRLRDFALPAAAAAALLIAVYLSRTESVYVAAKALAPAGALTMAMSAGAILGRPALPRPPGARAAIAVAGAIFVAGALWSSFLVLRGAQIGPREHERELARIQPTVRGQDTLFLASDDFMRAMLPEVPVSTRPLDRPSKAVNYDGPFDFDSPTSTAFDRIRFVIAPRTRYRSEPPANFELIQATRSFELWERRGPTPRRHVLAGERAAPGAILDCSTRSGRVLARRAGWASVWPTPPRLREVEPRRRVVRPGGRETLDIDLGRGRWELSLQYTSSQPIATRSSSRGQPGGVVANLDRGGSFWRIGHVRRTSSGYERILLTVADEPLGASSHYAVIEAVAAVRVDQRPRLVPLRRACGSYVDWYTLGPRRPASG